MIFSHEPQGWQDPDGAVPISDIKELFFGPNSDFWWACVHHCLQERKRGNMNEVVRLISISVYAHARYHFNIPHEALESVVASSVIELINRLEELHGYHPTRMFFEIEQVLAHHEPYLPCLEPESDGIAHKREQSRFDPDS